MTSVVEMIKSRGYWDVEVRPVPFAPDRIAYERLEETLDRTTVRLRGWPVPFVEYRQPVRHGNDWVGQDVDARSVSHLEAWRLFTSGQFVHLRAISVDWGEANLIAPQGPVEHIIPVWEVLFYLTELVEFAARLTLRSDHQGTVLIRAKLVNMAGRALVVGQRNRAEFFEPYVHDQAVIEGQIEMTSDDLVASRREFAVQLARHFFLRFGWKPSLDQLRGHQQELLDR
jgi:hypothetical protein